VVLLLTVVVRHTPRFDECVTTRNKLIVGLIIAGELGPKWPAVRPSRVASCYRPAKMVGGARASALIAGEEGQKTLSMCWDARPRMGLALPPARWARSVGDKRSYQRRNGS
jgi:hypothetical protein